MLTKRDGCGLVAAYEILIVTSSIANLIREDKINQINNVMTTNKSIGMRLMDNSLENLANDGLISTREACERAGNPAAMVQLLKH